MKVTDTLKRVVKFDGVYIADKQFVDAYGDIVEQLLENVPRNVEDFKITVEMNFPEEITEEKSEETDIE